MKQSLDKIYGNALRRVGQYVSSLVLGVQLLLLLSSLSFANPPCTTCLTDIELGQSTIQCSNGHDTHQECLHDQVQKTEDVTCIQHDGFRCNGLDQAGCQCNQSFSLEQIRQALTLVQMKKLDERLVKAFKPTDKLLFDQEVRKLSQGMIEAFVPCCPNEGCGGSLDQIAGCNAASCSEADCKTTFCYLCLEKQANGLMAHAHVEEHSGDYWDSRPGYIERYHWLLARKELGNLLKRKVEPAVMEAVLKFQQSMLKERNMWPFSAGKKTLRWLQEVQAYAPLSPEKRIELLQNEAIYRRQIKDLSNSTLVEAEIRKLGGKVLASLDLRDAQGVNPVGVAHGVIPPQNRPAVPVSVAVVSAEVLQPMLDEAEVTPQFSALGNMYQVGSVVWSSNAAGVKNQRDAKQYCKSLGDGSRLPTGGEWRALLRAMGQGIPDRHYNPNLIADTQGYQFWSSSSKLFSGGKVYDGTQGTDAYVPTSQEMSLRCVKDAKSLVLENGQKVPHKFAQLGTMHQAVGLMWSGISSEKMNQQQAKLYCEGLGRGSRLPTEHEWQAMARAMGYPGAYHANLLPGSSGKRFGSSSVHAGNAGYFYYFYGSYGNVRAHRRRSFEIHALCVAGA